MFINYKINQSKKLLLNNLGQLKFFSKPIIKRFKRVQRKRLNQSIVFNNYLFMNRLGSFYYFKNSTARRAVYGKHYFLTSFLEGLLSGEYNYAICQLPIRKKSEFRVVRDFILDNGLRALLLSKRNIDYLKIYGFNKPFFRILLKGGYTFIFYSKQIVPFMYFLLRKLVFSLMLKKANVVLKPKTYFNYTDNVNDKYMFAKINCLHYNIQSIHSPVALIDRMLLRFLVTPLFVRNIDFSKSSWYKQPILWLLFNMFKTRYLLLALCWQEKIKK